MNWIKLNESPPKEETGEVLGCHWICGNYQVHVCELPPVDRWYCGEPTGQKSLLIKNSIAPNIGNGESPYWCPLPEKEDSRWVKFDIESYSKDERHDVLIQLFNGNYYVASIGNFEWNPSFSMFKSGFIDAIKCWMGLPAKPPYDPEKFTPEEEALREEKSMVYFKKLNNEYKQWEKDNPGGTMKFKRFKPIP